MTSRTSMRTSGSQRKSGRVARSTRSFGSRMRSPGPATPGILAIAGALPLPPRLGRSAPGGGDLGCAGRGADEALQSVDGLTGHDPRDPVQHMQRAVAVLRDLALDTRPHVELVEDGADLLDVLRRQRRRRREERVE